MAYLLLGLAQAAGLLILPFWGAGIWLQLGSLALFGWWSRFQAIGWVPLFVLLAAAVAAELAEPPLAGGRIDPGLRRRGGIGSLVGGAAGVAAGVSFPLLGVLFGTLGGALVGSGIATFTRGYPGPGRANALGQAIALAIRVTAAIGIAAFAIYSVRA